MTEPKSKFDVIVIGLGFGGTYGVYRYREMGLDVVGIDSAADVGGVWYHNRYPGARCDVRSLDYSYSFDDALQQEWEWSETYSAQPEILRYIQHVADRFDLRRNMIFNTRVVSAQFNAETARWTATTNTGLTLESRFLVLATGGLSTPKQPDFKGLESFKGEWYQTARWPHEPVSFAGKKVGVIGTGSSGVQTVPVVAEQAEHLTVFQRTPVFTNPAGNGPIDQNGVRSIKARYPEYRREMRAGRSGNLMTTTGKRYSELTPQERRDAMESFWNEGGIGITGNIVDTLTNQETNDFVSEFVREKIRATVNDQEVARKLEPWDHPIGTRRPVMDTNYYATFNRDNVTLADIKADPIEQVTETGIQTVSGQHYPLDIIIFAIGFDAFTGAVSGIDLRNDKGENLADLWRDGPKTYFGLMAAGFPNMFIVTGPYSPSVLANMVMAVEHDIDWIGQTIAEIDRRGLRMIDCEAEKQEAWIEEVAEIASHTLYPKANSWYVGANMEGKARIFLPYVGGFNRYEERLKGAVANDYEGFRLS